MNFSNTSLMILSCFVMLACGNDQVSLNPSAASESDFGGDLSADELFEQSIFPVLIATTDNGSCLDCHRVGDALQSGQGFYQIDPDSVVNSLNWANARRGNEVDEASEYTNGTSETLKSKADDAHNTFQFWTPAELNDLDLWSNR